MEQTTDRPGNRLHLAKQRWRPLSVVVVLVALVFGERSANSHQLHGVPSGCADGTTEGLQDRRHWKLAACDGRWEGHVTNATKLCATGWKLCGWNTTDILKTLSWTDAMSLTGCYALNAAQDSGQCKPCINDIQQDDLAGVGSGCPHRSQGTDSCITGGQMDASCCTDTYYNKACSYRPGITNGVLCCRQTGSAPKLVIPPAQLTHAQIGGTFVLSCQAIGSPVPRVTWLRNGQPISIDTNMPRRIAAFESGYLIVSDAQLSDSTIYQCVASNTIGDIAATARVVVTEHPSGCADGTTEGLAEYEEIQACRGRWKGHVKRARSLCAAGWMVCSPRHASSLKLLTWNDVTDRLNGCYAYNAANTLNLCTVCQRDDLAGVGRHCGRHRIGQKSCLAEGRIDVHETKIRASRAKCDYVDNRTTGVLCCRRPEKWQIGYRWSAPKCQPKCQNGGVCVSDGQCQCLPGYKGALCQNPMCPGGCIPNSVCIRPSMCRCLDGYLGPKCKIRQFNQTIANGKVSTGTGSSPEVVAITTLTATGVRPMTSLRCTCLNGGRCVNQLKRCKCPPTHRGDRCEHYVARRLPTAASDVNRTEQ